MVWIRASEDRVAPQDAKEKRLLCPHCQGAVYTSPERISEAIDEHRRICTGASVEVGRVYRIDYPRS